MGEKKMDGQNYLTVSEASQVIRMSKHSLRLKIKAGLLPAYKPGRQIILLERDLNLFVKRYKRP